MSGTRDVFQPLRALDPQVVGGYRLVARLGAGGMGRVYLAYTRGGRPVAVKVVRPELADDPGFQRRFAREIKAAQRVRGVYTAEVIDADVHGEPPWLATSYVPGPSLSQAVARHGPLSVPAVLWLMAGMAEALRAIHAEGIVHRDLKPSNVLLSVDGPRVIDFGIATAADATAYTVTGQAVGTPAYMAPEQASGGEVTGAADVFSLAQTAAFAALGEPLYGEGQGVDVLYRIVHSEPDLSSLPESLRPLFARCLSADPADRATPDEVLDWCRGRLGPDADGGGAPAVWRRFSEQDVELPPPLPDPTPVGTRLQPQPWTRAQPVPQAQPPRFPFGLPVPPAGAEPTTTAKRGRRTALISAVALAGIAALLALVAPPFMDLVRQSVHQVAARSSDSTGTEVLGAGEGAAGSPSSSASSRNPKPQPYPAVYLDAKTSANLDDPTVKVVDGTGELRFGCETAGCELESDTLVFRQMVNFRDITLDDCRSAVKGRKDHRLFLAGTADGSEICVKSASGDIGLLVIGIKATAVPEAGFVQADMTIWRGAA
ncbi:serine/threonine protein kinase [Streptomyces sp. NBC_00247]|uniref:serine/threonine-protein kinase n=1 Tax=Streptomyces sp. NBC_00247 TaxID=2975689 RepID=UPI002E2C435D|nr:serine/threonine-protein kinase [Streptomyces sp. NBC_00247]